MVPATRPARPSGRTNTIPFVPWPLALPIPPVHGRVGAGSTLWCPGGPLASPGHGGRGFTSWATGAGVGVGRGVGWGVAVGRGVAVGCGVAVEVGVAVGLAIGVDVGFGVLPAGVGLGPSATVGGDGDAPGVSLGTGDGSEDGTSGGEALGVSADGSLDGAGADERADDGAEVGTGDGEMRATSPGRVLGATAPAVSATVARMRFNTPMATTSRAR